MPNIDWSKIKLVIFDVDGTLYDQGKLRKFIIFELFSYYILRPWKILDLIIIYKFRKFREDLSQQNAKHLEALQYSGAAKSLFTSSERVKKVILEWLYNRPLKYLKECRYEGVLDFINNLEKRGILIAYFSDYPLENKLTALELPFSNKNIFYAGSSEIDAFKPNTKGLVYILEKFGLNAESVLLIGDREDKEGIMAKKIGMPYLIINKQQPQFYKNIIK